MVISKEPLILSQIENGILKVTLNRPEKKNAINEKMLKELNQILIKSAENSDILALVITGSGQFYSSGYDFVGQITESDFNRDENLNIVGEFIDLLISFPKLLIAIVNGPAIGIAVTTLSLFDIVYASETAFFQTPFCKLGICPEGCSSYLFPRIMGPSKASEILFFGEKLSAKQAFEIGFVGKVYRVDSVNEVWTHLKKIPLLSKQSLITTKKLLSKWNKEKLKEINKQELKELKKMFEYPDFLENMTKFILKKSKM